MAKPSDPQEWPSLDDEIASKATFLAMCVRNAMEGTVHGGELGDLSLTDEQMAALNPIVRNAIATGLHAMSNPGNPAVTRYINFQMMLVPSYWERPQLLAEYIETVGSSKENQQQCWHCGKRIVPVGSNWRHVGADGGLYVGCRAASFKKGSGWDDSLPKSWKAAPRR
jgi:hypothetical protein